MYLFFWITVALLMLLVKLLFVSFAYMSGEQVSEGLNTWPMKLFRSLY